MPVEVREMTVDVTVTPDSSAGAPATPAAPGTARSGHDEEEGERAARRAVIRARTRAEDFDD